MPTPVVESALADELAEGTVVADESGGRACIFLAVSASWAEPPTGTAAISLRAPVAVTRASPWPCTIRVPA